MQVAAVQLAGRGPAATRDAERAPTPHGWRAWDRIESPPGWLTLPAPLEDAIAGAVRAGLADAASWHGKHPDESQAAWDARVAAALPEPPDAATTSRELAELHELAATRDEQGVEIARWHAAYGGWEAWRGYVGEIGRRHGDDAGNLAQRLLSAALARTGQVTDEAKERFGRERPFQQDPTLETAVPRPHGNASYPSGHTGSAIAASVVLASMLPERADELLALGRQTAFSRMYGGVHFRSDVLASSCAAAQVAADVLRRGGVNVVAG